MIYLTYIIFEISYIFNILKVKSKKVKRTFLLLLHSFAFFCILRILLHSLLFYLLRLFETKNENLVSKVSFWSHFIFEG